MTFRKFATAALMLAAATYSAAAQEYPARPVTLIVPFAAGGPTDVIARIVADHMSKTLGQQLVIENAVGAGGTTGSTRASRASPDGYTIVMGHMGTHAASVALYPNLAYHPSTSFEPIGLVAGTPVLVLARKDFPAKNLQEFVAYVKANEAKMNMAHAGVGSVSFTTCLLLNSIMGVKPTAVPFNGTGPAMNALVGSAAVRSSVTPSERLSGIQHCRTSRLRRKPVCRRLKPRRGTRCSRRRARRSRSSTSSPPRSTRRSTMRRRASVSSISAPTSRTARAAGRRRSLRW